MDARLKQEAAKRDSPAEVTPPLVEAAAPVEAEPAAKHVPSMPQRKQSLDVRLQESVKSEEGGAPAAAAPLAEGQGFLKRASTLFGLLGESEAKSE